MRPIRATRAFAPRPNMRAIAGSPRRPFRAPWRPHREKQMVSDADHPPLRGGATIGWSRIVLPIVTLALGVVTWDLVVRVKDIPPFILPGPGLVAATVLRWRSPAASGLRSCSINRA